ncbi:MAG: queuosine precursor transporter [Patescibacteria group bacterium]|mgnify:CR=1 FL=1
MSTELVLLTMAVVEFVSIIALVKLPIRFVSSLIVVNLVLISLYGSSLITVAGFTTNAGNIFYVAITFTFYILIDKYGREVAYRAIWSSAFLLLLFILVSALTSIMDGATPLYILPRLTFASIAAFLVAQHINLHAYEKLLARLGERFLWIRLNGANIITQLVDSLIFFLIAFYATDISTSIWEIMIAGFLLKVLAGALATCFLYLDRSLFRHSPS